MKNLKEIKKVEELLREAQTILNHADSARFYNIEQDIRSIEADLRLERKEEYAMRLLASHGKTNK